MYCRTTYKLEKGHWWRLIFFFFLVFVFIGIWNESPVENKIVLDNLYRQIHSDLYGSNLVKLV